MVHALNLSAQESIAKNIDKGEKMQEKQVLVKKENLAVYDKVSDKIFAGGLPKSRYFFLRRLTQMQGRRWSSSAWSTHGVAHASCEAKFNRNAG